MSTLYDLVLLLDSEAPSARREEILGEVESAISRGGSLETKHPWGVRKLSYEIDHRTEADYHLLQFTGSRDLLESLQRYLKLTDGVVRARIIKVKPGTPPPPAVRAPEPPAAAQTRPGEEAAPAAESSAAEQSSEAGGGEGVAGEAAPSSAPAGG